MAIGCIGMTRVEFCDCAYDEFEHICKAWREMTDSLNREQWERTRLLAAITIQPHIRKRITPRQLLPLPWDQKQSRDDKIPELTDEEKRKRFEEIAHRLGDEINQ